MALAKELTKAQVATLAVFAADTFSLSYHWIYDASKIPSALDALEGPHAQYHPNRKAGEYSMYGDQLYVLLESVHKKKRFDLEDFAATWKELFAHYTGYFDHATKTTLANFEAHKSPAEAGSPSTDFSAVARVIAPLLLIYEKDHDLEALKKNAQIAAAMTHNSSESLESTVFFAAVAASALDNKHPVEAIKELAPKSSPLVQELVKKALDAKDIDTTSAIKSFGQSCSTNFGFPGVVHAIVKHADNLTAALQANLAAGGDTCARGNAIALVLGAYHGKTALPSWTSKISKYDSILNLSL